MTQRLFRILFAENFAADVVESARSVGEVVELAACDDATLRNAVPDCDALLVRSSARVTRAVIEEAKHLRVIGRGGVGLENIDLAAATERGITVVHTPAASTEAVADLTIGLMIAVLRGIVKGDQAVRAGRFRDARAELIGCELSELTLGIVGLGRIGRAVARRCRRGFNMRIVYNDIVDPGLRDFVAAPLSKAELFAESDLVSLHVPLTSLTHRMINEETLSRFKSNAILINTARGAVVDDTALVNALHSGAVAGAGLDVFEPEPPPSDHPLVTNPSVVLTPHLGARTPTSLARMNAVLDDVIRVLKGEPPEHPADLGGAHA